MFHWDSSNISHIGKHDVSPEEAEQVFTNAPFDIERQFRSGEERTAHIGETAAGRVLIVIVTIRRDSIRVVTAFPANRAMRKFYSKQKELRHAQDFRNS